MHRIIQSNNNNTKAEHYGTEISLTENNLFDGITKIKN